MKKILVIIPARGGSKGIPKKNIRLMAKKPLISYCIATAKASAYKPEVVVSTDDNHIGLIAKQYGATVIPRSDELATDKVTLDPVIYDATLRAEELFRKTYDVVITMQPTSPLLETATLDKAIEHFLSADFDTVLSGVNHPHLAWQEQNGETVPLYKERLNRQYLPKHLMETGAFFISKRECVTENNRIGKRVSVFEVSEKESIDIDTPQDWWVAERQLLKKNIILRVKGYKEIGTGHIQRCLLLADNFIEHNVLFVVDKQSDIAIEKIKESFFPYRIIDKDEDIIPLIKEFSCDVLVNDMLNTTEKYIKECKKTGVRVVNFEDLGTGAKLADGLINDLYEEQPGYRNAYWGSKYYCIREEFLLAEPGAFREQVKEIFVSFGGTDPSDLTKKLLNCVEDIQKETNVHFTFVLGMGYKNYNNLIKQANGLNVDIVRNVTRMSDYMARADIAVSSQGRTMLELARMAVPTVLLAENEREQDHEFGYLQNGFFNLGLGEQVTEDTIKKTILWLINSAQIRSQIREQMLGLDLTKGIDRVKKIILDS